MAMSCKNRIMILGPNSDGTLHRRIQNGGG
jgi:hypothetical protein